MMLNKYEIYQRTNNMFQQQQLQQHQQQQQQLQQQHQQQQQQASQQTSLQLSHSHPHAISYLDSAASSTVGSTAAELAAMLAASKAERESIHSGQFMVSHFEAEEAQDDLEDDGEVKMLDPEDPSLDKPGAATNTCRDVQLYVPQTVAHFPRMDLDRECDDNSMGMSITSHLEIETSLTKLFKCMNLAYR
ncbi:PREDICTED: putative GATA zinc finger domain-containing protein 25 [Drosophila arizonae]|uniref:GATA zinc finger domain-containing protein 25 n=1 Tax=Drosophila arizonae TaxID=7263 RepID=A0ABM1NVB7_DROAR|nr:PREDICTED: putative GATA zinc finger domain-containing protein 25 [Drosophila arizonae]